MKLNKDEQTERQKGSLIHKGTRSPQKFWVSKYKVRQSWLSTRQDPDGAKIFLDRRRRSSQSSPHLNICPRSYCDTRIAVIWIVITWIVTTHIILNLKSLTCRVETNTSEEEEQQHCCLDSVIVDFAALGWHFILSPPVLEFTYCRLLSSKFFVVFIVFASLGSHFILSPPKPILEFTYLRFSITPFSSTLLSQPRKHTKAYWSGGRANIIFMQG